MIRTYIRVEMSSEGESPKQVIERMRRIGAVPVVGDYDFELTVGEQERLFDRLEEIHRALRGSGARYSVTTRADLVDADSARTKHQITHFVDQKPVELKKKFYRAKLERWKTMGLDVAELEPILEKDLDHFKEASKDFLKTHLDRLAVITDAPPTPDQVDRDIVSHLDENGKGIDELMSLTGSSEAEVTLALGRLIAAGSAKRLQTGGKEIFSLAPPPAPPARKPLQLEPAGSEEEAEERILRAIPNGGISFRSLVRKSRLPKEQTETALSSLLEKGKVKRMRRNKKDFFARA